MINSKKSVAHLHKNHKWTKKENRKMASFAIATNNIYDLGVTLTKQVRTLYNKIFKSLKKEIEEHSRRWKDLPCSWFGRIKIVKVVILSKSIYRFNAISIQIPTQFFFTHPGRTILNFI